MNQPISELNTAGSIEIVARPNRSSSIPTLVLVFCALTLAVTAVAVFSFRQGNAFVPYFALFDILLVGASLWWVWRRGDDFDRVSIGFSALTVEQRRRGRSSCAEYATPWARLWAERQVHRTALLVGSHGRATEIGEFLADTEREQLSSLLRQRLTEMRAGERK